MSKSNKSYRVLSSIKAEAYIPGTRFRGKWETSEAYHKVANQMSFDNNDTIIVGDMQYIREGGSWTNRTSWERKRDKEQAGIRYRMMKDGRIQKWHDTDEHGNMVAQWAREYEEMSARYMNASSGAGTWQVNYR